MLALMRPTSTEWGRAQSAGRGLRRAPKSASRVNGKHGTSIRRIARNAPNCSKALTSLLTPTPRAGLNGDEYLSLVGALGVLVGLALATTDESAG